MQVVICGINYKYTYKEGGQNEKKRNNFISRSIRINLCVRHFILNLWTGKSKTAEYPLLTLLCRRGYFFYEVFKCWGRNKSSTVFTGLKTLMGSSTNTVFQ